MRASTAAGINISLLPQDATAVDLPVGICWWCRLGKGSLFPGVCWLRWCCLGKRLLFPGIFGKFVDGAILEKASFF